MNNKIPVEEKNIATGEWRLLLPVALVRNMRQGVIYRILVRGGKGRDCFVDALLEDVHAQEVQYNQCDNAQKRTFS